ncbi:MAG TPA: hypothetical protein H9668_09785 [Firmicutes bacterium]|nr:hypothetical protein [Bacillota bacterium]
MTEVPAEKQATLCKAYKALCRLPEGPNVNSAFFCNLLDFCLKKHYNKWYNDESDIMGFAPLRGGARHTPLARLTAGGQWRKTDC